jgi:hypothetical protein
MEALPAAARAADALREENACTISIPGLCPKATRDNVFGNDGDRGAGWPFA